MTIETAPRSYYMSEGFCIWFTGLSASGKTTLARLLEGALLERGLKVEVLDGDVIRSGLSKDLGFTREDREINLRRIAFVAKLLARNGVAVIVGAISPYRKIRHEVREEIGAFVEVFVNAPIEICMERDPKGLYKKALAGKIKSFTGVDDPFETPARPEIEVRTDEEKPEESLARILRSLEILGRIPNLPEAGYSDEESLLIERRLKDLGYI